MQVSVLNVHYKPNFNFGYSNLRQGSEQAAIYGFRVDKKENVMF